MTAVFAAGRVDVTVMLLEVSCTYTLVYESPGALGAVQPLTLMVGTFLIGYACVHVSEKLSTHDAEPLAALKLVALIMHCSNAVDCLQTARAHPGGACMPVSSLPTRVGSQFMGATVESTLCFAL